MVTPSVSSFVRGLEQLAIPRLYIDLLRAHYCAPDHIITPTQMAGKLSLRGYQAINLHYGLLGKCLGEAMGYAPTEADEKWTHVLATGGRIGAGQKSEWRMRPELAQALVSLGIVK